MELADVTDSKSVGSNTVRVRPPPSAPKSVTPLNEWGYIFYVLVGGRTRNLRVVHGCTMAVAQSRRKDAPTQTTAKARMPYKMNAQSFKQGCIKTATQSRCTMQRHKWLSMHRCNGTNGCRCTDAAAQMAVDAQMQRPKRPQTQGCVIVLAQSFARCETNRASTIRQPRPATLSPTQQAGYYFWRGGCENPQLAGKAQMLTSNNLYNF